MKGGLLLYIIDSYTSETGAYCYIANISIVKCQEEIFSGFIIVFFVVLMLKCIINNTLILLSCGSCHQCVNGTATVKRFWQTRKDYAKVYTIYCSPSLFIFLHKVASEPVFKSIKRITQIVYTFLISNLLRLHFFMSLLTLCLQVIFFLNHF